MVTRSRTRFARAMAFSLIAVLFTFGGAQAASDATVIQLTQTGCQFVEIEGVDHGFKTESAADCKKINARTGKDRLAKAKTLVLKPGKYIFRVTNKNVSYPLGFYLRGKGLSRFTLPKVSGGGLALGKTADFVVNLKVGNYLYSCPLNPTPNYKLVVKN